MHQRVLVREILWVMEDSKDFFLAGLSSGSVGVGRIVLWEDVIRLRNGSLLNSGGHFTVFRCVKK